MPNQTFGIDHPVVTVRDFDKTREQFKKLGFAPNPVGYHPWGTVMSLLMFRDNFIEIIAVHDASKFGTNSVNGFCYGRNVGQFTDRVEGLGLVALHSKDARTDHAALTSRGLKSQGLIDFRRDMKKPDGSPDVAIVSLGLFLNEEQRDVSNFICHQHRPELIWVKEWMKHPNGVNAVVAVTYIAKEPMDLAARYRAFYGDAGVKTLDGTVEADSGFGVIRILTPHAVAERLGPIPLPDWKGDTSPHGIALSVSTPDFDKLPGIWDRSGIQYRRSPVGTYLISPEQCGNVIMEFVRAK
ncbi:VOC family protein [Variovorax ureilyticus]|uniref:VOC family protein n=1 Tax=Variovorax ureilyticus TaxID=1836198 RepID=A0ABU8VKW7_9BURK